ncbi:MFS family permease [Desulfitispora alkaliphila]|uniref:MFS transporter n=1 Tax=Desulfitispora alkaliphila TaxID=622674 RepID=UPI003D249992
MEKAKEAIWTKQFVLISAINFILFIAFQILLPTLPMYAESIGGGELIAGLVIGIFTIAAVLVRPYAGMLADLKGRKIVLLFGLAIFILSAISYTWAITLWALLLLRVVHGIGWAAATTGVGTIAADIVPASRRGEGMGYYGMWINVSLAFSPALGIFIVNSYGFETLFLASTALATVGMLLAVKFKYKDISQQEIKREGKAKPKIIEPTSFKTSAVLFFLTFIYGGVVTFIALYAVSMGIEEVGLFFTVMAMLMIIARPIAGRLSDNYGADVVVIPGLLIVAVSMLVLGLATNLHYFIIAAALLGVGFGSVQPSLQALTIQLAPASRRGAANATFFSAFDLGIGSGAIILGIVVSVVGYSYMYIISSIAAIIGLGIYLFALKGDSKKKIASP